ncbi:MAG: geranylgeranyl reductase family protein [Anaerolineae bacterium]
MDYDVIVIGAGIGGAAAAYYLGEAGCKVLVLERERLPRYKPCGGGVPRSVFRYFPFPLDQMIETRVARIRYSYQGQEEVTIPLPGEPVAMVMRDKLDALVLKQARCAVREATPVTEVVEGEDGVVVSTRDGQEFRGRYLIGADGANSTTARKLGLRRGKLMGAALEAEVPLAPIALADWAQTALFEFGALKGGYLWIFPKREHLSVGIGAFRKSKAKLKNILRQEMAKFGLSLDGVTLHGHPLPIYIRSERLNTARSLLIGDAARLMDPLSGEGIRYAVKSARLAAEAIVQGELDKYTAWVQREIGANLSRARWVAALFYGLPRLCFRLGVRNPRVTRLLAAMLNDRATYFDLSRHILPYLIKSLGRRTADGQD